MFRKRNKHIYKTKRKFRKLKNIDGILKIECSPEREKEMNRRIKKVGASQQYNIYLKTAIFYLINCGI